MSSNMYFKDINNFYYVIGNIKEKWMGKHPFMCSKKDNLLKLQYLQDLSYSVLKNENENICFSIFKIKGHNTNEFDSNSFSLLYNNLSLNNYEKVKDIEYVVDKNNKTQIFDNIEVTFCYNEWPQKFGDKIYIDCPTIYIEQ